VPDTPSYSHPKTLPLRARNPWSTARRCADVENCGASFSCTKCLAGLLASCSTPGHFRMRPRTPPLTGVKLLGEPTWSALEPIRCCATKITTHGCMTDICRCPGLDCFSGVEQEKKSNDLARTFLGRLAVCSQAKYFILAPGFPG